MTAIIVSMLITIILTLIMGLILGKDDLNGLLLILFVFTALGLTLLFIADYDEKNCKQSYKQGQVDALTNKIHYKLETQIDSTTTWVEIKGNNE